MIRLKKGNGVLRSFFFFFLLVDGFFFPLCFSLWPLQTVLGHPCMLPTAGQEAITSFYTCRVTCLLTFDLYLAIERHYFRCHSPSFTTLAILYKRKLPDGLCICSSIQASLVLSLPFHSYVLI